ncbi:MAG: outer membrane protein assembly factor BamE [Magnetococcales bacterium]|nr:outer membrane protein assembly factor BamE [Magnetococcales bacterium]
MPKPFLILPRTIFFLILLIGLAGCQARMQETGSMIKPEDVNKIVVGVTNHEEVKKLLGPATIINTFRRERWIYIQDRRYKNMQRTFARAVNRIEITFDKQGIVEKIERNFGDSLIDPENNESSSLRSKWGSWFWKGSYDKPATGEEAPSSPTTDKAEETDKATVEGKPAADKQETDGAVNGEDDKKAKDWWRFW